ncbi:hypothetical protein TRFO_13277 [Tritrichomonas foetus]|uniref:Sel1 repeat family protein n=1 Tax=Tritrichomonas foetus TaxID=1144522 RepID=A0A1J4KZH8_9EUKA|nr:hypothetical protein TRFO_13277 [Tritrichomonas foetus]|eukprot:OHT16272.1 hypothetical protein TRFO_13277 [Tritrichomonas foetus]
MMGQMKGEIHQNSGSKVKYLMSSYLRPQNPLTPDEISQGLRSLSIFQKQHKKFTAEANNQIDQQIYSTIVDSIEKNKVMASTDVFPKDSLYDSYEWSQTENKIIISYKSDSEKDLQCSIQGNNISSSSGFISGILYKQPLSSNIKVDGQKVEIELTVSETWPILIIGGENIDTNSLFILSAFATKLNLSAQSEKLLIHGAMRNHLLSMQTLAFLYMTKDDKFAAFYFYCLLYLNFNDPAAFACICEVLFSIEGKEYTPNISHLAENILVEEAKKEKPIAFLYIGYLHMSKKEGFKSDDALAFKYFETAATRYGNKKSLDTMGRCYLYGLGVEADLKLALKYFLEADLPKDKILSLFAIANIDRQTIVSLFKEQNVSLDEKEIESIGQDSKFNIWILISAAALIAGSIFVGYSIYKRRKR